jgi:hypothetical protein
MKKLITSAGLVVLGAAGVQAAGYAPGYGSTDNSKPWSVGLTLSGFYDSNPFTYPSGGLPAPTATNPNNRLEPISSWGFEVSPFLSGAYSTDQTQFGARYTFSMDYYMNYPENKAQNSQLFNFFVNHRFSSKSSITVVDNFAYSPEPEVLSAAQGNSGGIPYRTAQDNYANTGTINFNQQLTELVSLVLGYSNNYINYTQTPSDLVTPTNPYGGGSLAALMNRIENYITANFQYQVSMQTMALVGFQYGRIGYTGDGYLYAFDPTFTNPSTVPTSSDRNSNNYYLYVGGTHSFNADLSLSLKAGAMDTVQFNSPNGYSQWAPYVDLSLNYRYSTKGSVTVGFTQSFAATYVLANNSSSSMAYATINYNFTPKLTGSLLGRLNYNNFNGGVYDGQHYTYYAVGLNMNYAFDRHFSFDAGYNLDYVSSESAAVWEYNRNRVYFGVTAKY